MRGDDVDLLVVDAVFRRDGDRDEEDAEDVVAVRLQRRPRLVVMLRRPQEQLERRVLHLGRELCAQLVLARIEQVDPLGHAAEVRRGFG